MRSNDDNSDKIIAHKYRNWTTTTAELLSEIIVSGRFCAAENWHRVTVSPQRLEVKAKALKFVVKSNRLKEKVFIS